jgi:hypothetical protein
MTYLSTVLRIQFWDPESDAFLTPGSGMGKNQDPGSGSGMNNPDHIFESLVTILVGLKYLNYLMRIRIHKSCTERKKIRRKVFMKFTSRSSTEVVGV